jgi:hypothetical protein
MNYISLQKNMEDHLELFGDFSHANPKHAMAVCCLAVDVRYQFLNTHKS